MNGPQTAPETRPKRRFWRWLGYAAAILLLLFVCILIFRQEIAGAAARFYLKDQGIAVESLAVSRLDTRSLVFERVQLGTANELFASRIAVAFNAGALSVNPERITIAGLRLRLDLTGEGPMLGSLQPIVDAQETEAPGDTSGTTALDGPLDSLPALHLSDAQAIAETGAGPMAVDVDGTLEPQTGGDLVGQLSARAAAEQGRLSATAETRLSADGSLAVKVQIDQGQIDWQSIAVGALTGSIDLTADAEGAPDIAADLKLRDLNYRPADAAVLNLTDGRLSVSGELSGFALQASLTGPGESLLVDTKGAVRSEAGEIGLTLATSAELQTSGGLAAYLPLAEEALAEGKATLVAELSASLPPGSPRPERWQDLKALPQTAAADLVGEVILAEVALKEGSSGISAHLPLTAKLRENALEITLSDDSALQIGTPSERNLRDLGIPNDVLPLLTSGLSVSVAAQGSRPFRLNLQPAWPPRKAEITATTGFTSEQGVSASLALEGSALMDQNGALAEMDGSLAVEATLERFRLGDREARGVSANLPLTVALDAKGISLALAEPGSLRLRQLSGDLPLRLNEPVRLAIDRATLEQEEGTARYRYRLGSRTASVKARVEPAAGEALDVELGRTALTFGGTFDPVEGHAAEIAAEISDTAIPAYGFGIERLTANTRLDRDLRPVESRFVAQPVTLDAKPARLAPLTIEGKLRRRGGGYDIDAAARLIDGDLKVAEVDLRYNDVGTADAKLRVDPVLFAPGGLQPADIAPALAVLADVAGSVSAEAALSWPRNAAAESGSLGLRNLSFGIEGVRFQNLSLDLALTSLLPLSSAKNQQLTIGRIDAGAPVEDIDLRFNLDQEPQPHLEITGGGFDLGGADWQVEPTTLDPGAARNSIALATNNLDLATFFRLIEIEGLSGSGVLAGRIPVVFEDNSIVIEDGVLAAQGPGVLSIRSQALASALAGGGKTVELAIKALEDFRYESLSVKLNKTAGNEAQVLLSILGSNPAVLDGQPFQFNINLESNLTSVLEALRQGYSLSDEALRRAWRLSD